MQAPGSRRKPTRSELALAALVGALGASACGADDEVALGSSVLPPPSPSSTSASDSEDVPPDVGEPLPEGCGDGIVDPEQLCYAKQRVVWADLDIGVLSASDIVITDLDQDDRDELLMLAKPIDDPFADMMSIAYEDGKFVKRWQTEPGVGDLGLASAARDLDADGDPDLLIQGGPGFVAFHENLGGTLAPIVYLGDTWYGDDYWLASGFPVPIDGDGDGELEKLVATMWMPGEVRGGWIFEREGDGWQGVEGPIELSGCQSFGESLFGDFDGDGVDDFVVREFGDVCDPYSADYDPQWWRFYVFLTRPSLRTVEYVGSFPAGGTHAMGMYRVDFDEDGNLDLIFDVYRGVSFIRGNGDGTFEEPVVYEAPEGTNYSLIDVADFDGDGRPDLFVWIDGNYFVAPLEPVPDPARLRPIDGSDELYWYAVADLNGDGLTDILFKDPESEAKPRDGIALLSVP
ncbi:FG-GAP repeat domain-containing protein [Paraliomyxa miuraensis]|uniref:FG-GAP repeat domain-containing protein n=1 Tax=Paraliomyxa miuraensis TaxID=376150 RepID=UPI00224FA78F|nr:VCBS repeat-containing protein [Paraliomyxa miuraensis]MCX4242522.1 VCBS repeat-containing protein [Paraliomyxa miuraensis]